MFFERGDNLVYVYQSFFVCKVFLVIGILGEILINKLVMKSDDNRINCLNNFMFFNLIECYFLKEFVG